MKSLGLDLSLCSTGYAVIDNDSILEAGTVKTDNTLFKVAGGKSRRIEVICSRLMPIVHEYQPEIITVEGYALGGIGRVFDLAELGGVLKHKLFYTEYANRQDTLRRGSIFIMPPKSLKAFAGHGNAEKADMKRFAQVNFGEVILDNDACDAFFLALVGLYSKQEFYKNIRLTTKQDKSLRAAELYAPRNDVRKRI